MSEQTDPREDPTTGADHHGEDGRRDAVWAGSTQEGREQRATQDLPAMSQHPADVSDKIDGVVAQTRADAAGHENFDVRRVLVERLAQAGIEVDDAQLDDLAARASG
ncbi:hypothetical protein [Microbacterium dauci]|uniref:Anti-sigma-28 factor FlgM C-terminal domain-containing protein n=1 Tax=Microbacterium dauci TaxID=3048008 RepID=A0ABT6ZF19_9MICO|nr:hypothetical protein [Microbacterium sp. LX3-4]MDJ1114571.1 hypothetical protein [Microbacterium sp. LX3-4]